MRENGQNPHQELRKVDLGWYSELHPLEFIPLRPAAQFLRDLARQHTPNLPWRIVQDRGFFELGLICSVGMKADTLRGVMSLIEAAMSNHCTHEMFRAYSTEEGDLVIEEGWALSFDDETLHIIQQYFTAMVSMICGLTSAPGPYLRDVQMIPHPVYGFDHLGRWLGERVSYQRAKNLRLEIRSEVADAPIQIQRNKNDLIDPGMDWVPVRSGASTSYFVSLLLIGFLREGRPSIDRIAAAIGTSRRSLQRRLAEEGNSFSQILDDVRRQLANEHLNTKGQAIGTLASSLGYANQSAFTRAYRRWQGRPPTEKLKKQ